MHNGRDKIGQVEVDWRSLALGKKYERKTIGFGDYDKKRRKHKDVVFIREISVAAGALGCALWDGGVILARWIYDNPTEFRGKTVLELGSGCGLAGILCARYADHVTLTDYIDTVLDNIEYNIKINSDPDGYRDSSDEDEAADDAPKQTWSGTNASVGFLDWDAVRDETSGDASDGVGSGQKDAAAAECTCKEHGKAFLTQNWFRCRQCYGDAAAEGCCAACAAKCHGGHEGVVFAESSRFRCDCFGSESCRFSMRDRTNIDIAPVDIIIGAELTYSLLSVVSLVRVCKAFLKPGGTFYEVLSDDRDGVSEFVRQIGDAGFTVDSKPIPPKYMGNYNTRDWTYQDKETYKLFMFTKPSDWTPRRA